MCFDFICITTLLKSCLLKKLYTIHTSIILCWCMISNFPGISLSTYYQIVNLLNTKNNHIIIIFFICVAVFLNKKVFANNISCSILTMFILLYILTYCCIYIELTSTSNLIIFLNLKLNLNLINGLMLIHPPILYVVYSIILYTTYLAIYNSHTKYTTTPTQQYLWGVTTLVMFSNVLGCWWAEQELAWGGWWSWDFIEILLLNILIYNLFMVHSKYKSLNNVNFYSQIFFAYRCAILVIVVMVCVRYNFINSIHNFINSQIQNQHYYTLCFVLLICLFCTNRLLVISQHTKQKWLIFVGIIFNTMVFFFFLFLILTTLFPFISQYNININKIIQLVYYLIALYFTLYVYFLLWSTISSKLPINYTHLNPTFVLLCAVTCFLDYVFIYLSIFTLLYKKKNFSFLHKSVNKLHKLIILSFIIFLHQMYIFASDLFNIQHYNNIVLLKVSNQIIYQIYQNGNFVCNSLYPTINLLETISDIYTNNELFTVLYVIFEKKLYLYLCYLYESYNFDLQLLYQNTNFILYWCVVPFFYFILRVDFFFKKNFF